NVINFREFLLGISMLVEENIDTQIRVTYRIFDSENSGIKADFMVEVLTSALELLDNICIPRQVVQDLVKRTFENLNKEQPDKADRNTIDYQQYKKMIKQNPQILKWLYVDLQRVKQSAKLLKKNPKKFIKPLHSHKQSSSMK